MSAFREDDVELYGDYQNLWVALHWRGPSGVRINLGLEYLTTHEAFGAMSSKSR